MNSRKLIKTTSDFDKSSTFIEISKQGDRHPQQLSIETLLNLVAFPESHRPDKIEKYNIEKDIDKHSIIIDPCTLKIKVNTDILITPSVFGEAFTNQNILYNQPPENSSKLSGMHMSIDENYLYIWVGNRWKRTPLSEW
jgi:hypothetical protein